MLQFIPFALVHSNAQNRLLNKNTGLYFMFPTPLNCAEIVQHQHEARDRGPGTWGTYCWGGLFQVTHSQSFQYNKFVIFHPSSSTHQPSLNLFMYKPGNIYGTPIEYFPTPLTFFFHFLSQCFSFPFARFANFEGCSRSNIDLFLLFHAPQLSQCGSINIDIPEESLWNSRSRYQFDLFLKLK